MSLKAYRMPTEQRIWRPPLMDEDMERYNVRAKQAKKWIHPKLAFEQVVKNNTLPPCSLNDFMDYLMYVEQDAEPLQFFLWYCDYVQRWHGLSPAQRATAPRCDPDAGKKLSPKERRNRNCSKVSNVLDILEEDDRSIMLSLKSSHQRSGSAATNFSLPRTPEPVAGGSEEAAKLAEDFSRAQRYESQPFREEIDRIVAHYISAGSPRQLRLTKEDRHAILRATATSTHPSALLPAIDKAESVLRGKLHPNFVRYAMSNSNPALRSSLIFFGVLLTLVGIGLLAALCLSSSSRFWRILCATLYLTGLIVLIAAVDGVSVFLHVGNRRQPRPWEQAVDLEQGRVHFRRHLRKGTNDSSFSAVDPLRKTSLQVFGPSNEFRSDEWVESYWRKWLWRRVFDRGEPSQNPHLRVLQNGVLAGAVLWATILTIGLTVGSVFIPSWNMF